MRRPALSLVAMPGRRRKTLELAKEMEDRGFGGIFGPSFGDVISLCLSIGHVTEAGPEDPTEAAVLHLLGELERLDPTTRHGDERHGRHSIHPRTLFRRCSAVLGTGTDQTWSVPVPRTIRTGAS